MGALLGILYFLVCIAITVFMLVMMWRFVQAHESIARSVEKLAKSPFPNITPSGNDSGA